MHFPSADTNRLSSRRVPCQTSCTGRSVPPCLSMYQLPAGSSRAQDIMAVMGSPPPSDTTSSSVSEAPGMSRTKDASMSICSPSGIISSRDSSCSIRS